MQQIQDDIDMPRERMESRGPEAASRELDGSARQRRREWLTKFMMIVAALEFGVSVGNVLGNSLPV